MASEHNVHKSLCTASVIFAQFQPQLEGADTLQYERQTENFTQIHMVRGSRCSTRTDKWVDRQDEAGSGIMRLKW